MVSMQLNTPAINKFHFTNHSGYFVILLISCGATPANTADANVIGSYILLERRKEGYHHQLLAVVSEMRGSAHRKHLVYRIS